MALHVKAVADLVGISIRTLHHYDAIGLLKPDKISESGYREYSQANLETLQQILFFKELGFALKEIKTLLKHPQFDHKQALASHREMLLQKKLRLETMIQTVDKTLDALEQGKILPSHDLFGGFNMKKIKAHQKKYAAEAKARWGQTEAYQESQKRAANYTPADWEKIQAHQNQIYQDILAAWELGPESPEVQAAVAAYRQSITDYFYNCTPEIFRGLGQMYVQDERFCAFYEKIRPGMAEFLSQAIEFYCNALEA